MGPTVSPRALEMTKLFFTLACTLDFPDMAETLYRLFLSSAYVCVSFVVRCTYDLILEPYIRH